MHDRPPQSPAGIVQRLKSCYSSATTAAVSVWRDIDNRIVIILYDIFDALLNQ